jgi:hypothetical protein
MSGHVANGERAAMSCPTHSAGRRTILFARGLGVAPLFPTLPLAGSYPEWSRILLRATIRTTHDAQLINRMKSLHHLTHDHQDVDLPPNILDSLRSRLGSGQRSISLIPPIQHNLLNNPQRLKLHCPHIPHPTIREIRPKPHPNPQPRKQL